jgi:hypothetical protein
MPMRIRIGDDGTIIRDERPRPSKPSELSPPSGMLSGAPTFIGYAEPRRKPKTAAMLVLSILMLICLNIFAAFPLFYIYKVNKSPDSFGEAYYYKWARVSTIIVLIVTIPLLLVYIYLMLHSLGML